MIIQSGLANQGIPSPVIGGMMKYPCKIIRIIDGDTVEAEIELGFRVIIREIIRLWGIDTCETRTRDAEEKARGLREKQELETLISIHERSLMLACEGRGKFRWLGTLYGIHGLNLNLEMAEFCKKQSGEDSDSMAE